MDTPGLPTYRLLQPELLTTDELVEVLQRYNLKFDLKKTGNDELVEIYKRLALPLPQRTYPATTWRGRLLAKKQNRRKISFNEGSGNNSATIKGGTANNIGKQSSSQVTPSPQRDRLKPPLDASKSREKKIIKISSSSKTEDIKDRVVINNVSRKSTDSSDSASAPSETDDSVQHSKHKRIKIDFSDSAERSTPTPKVVTAKRLSGEKSPSQPASKHRRIII